VLNWGCSSTPIWNKHNQPEKWLNNFIHTEPASNKLKAFKLLENSNVTIPEFTSDKSIADAWIASGIRTVSRSVLSGHSGAGINIHDAGVLPNVPLYVKYIPKKKEFRVHVFNGTVIDIQEKRKRQEIPNEQVNYQVRNHHTGWVYCRENINKPEGLEALAQSACVALSLDFGAVDIIWNEKQNKCYVLEVNTAPGLEGETIEKYAQAIKGYMQ